jgi:hypothetical protein
MERPSRCVTEPAMGCCTPELEALCCTAIVALNKCLDDAEPVCHLWLRMTTRERVQLAEQNLAIL